MNNLKYHYIVEVFTNLINERLGCKQFCIVKVKIMKTHVIYLCRRTFTVRAMMRIKIRRAPATTAMIRTEIVKWNNVNLYFYHENMYYNLLHSTFRCYMYLPPGFNIEKKTTCLYDQNTLAFQLNKYTLLT